MEQKFDGAGVEKRRLPLPRRSDNMVVNYPLGLWAMVALPVMMNQSKLSYLILSYHCAFHYALSNLTQ